ncbi:gamma-glutamyl-gamma-aminobutyrate hydrolase family protein [Antiquaquibacter oligotrophicus]|uniref:gamma-glutamyl-gamma-aminobutyrate hydrolase family protein n=1 Tax=Antiquaquibacter oligotrophicus TaxID=2880260 RepID=UPI002AC9648B|nr:gamma-glutamyl-gamma-aminobutyrate hydrolase family protein [Antiquaquibacter oligotrophicus]UDF12689.1 gamma-glutamyl-gamma-aminobutyrate hydrolase family protein [Antiquaquibacter oligotrophicus]
MSGSELAGGQSFGAPIIGLTTYLEQAQTGVWDVPASFLPKVYFDAVNRAGGIAVLLPPQPVDETIAARIMDGLDGIIITGGKDVDPARYGQQPHPTTDAPRRDRDAWEDALLTAALERDIPFLGICRGAQVLNVARGGTLIQHLPDVIGSDRYNLGGGNFNTNEVHVDAGSAIGTLLGERATVKSYHHQAIDELGNGLVVTARSDDGIVQAVELPDHPFAVAVQWHPEEDAAEDARLFAGLVDAARAYRKQKA